MAALPVYIDTTTGRLRASESDNTEVALRAVVQGDKLDLALRTVTNDSLTTSTDLASGATLTITLKRTPDATTVLAQATSFTLNGEVASVTLNCNTTAIDSAFNSVSVSDLLCSIEFSITSPTGAATNSYQFPLALRRSAQA